MGLTITKGGALAPKNDKTFGISGIIASGVATSTGQLPCALLTSYKIHSLRELELKYAITQTYDRVHNCLVWYHISEFFRMAGDGTELWFYLVAATVKMEDYDTHATRLIKDSNRTIRQIAISRVPNALYALDIAEIDPDVIAAVPAMQQLAETAYKDHYPFQVLIEGRNIDSTATTLTVLDDLNLYLTNKISIVIAQDLSYVEAGVGIGTSGHIPYHAAVGTALGTIAGRALHERISKTKNGNLSDGKRWLKAGLSNAQAVQDFEAEWNDLETSHYVFAHAYFGYPGMYWHKGLTATAETDPEYTIENGKVLDESSRILYAKLLDYWDDDKDLNPDGTLPDATITEMEAQLEAHWQSKIGKSASNLKVTIDPTSDLINPPQELKLDFKLQPKGYIGSISATLTFVATI